MLTNTKFQNLDTITCQCFQWSMPSTVVTRIYRNNWQTTARKIFPVYSETPAKSTEQVAIKSFSENSFSLLHRIANIPCGMRRCSDVSLRSHTDRNVADHARRHQNAATSTSITWTYLLHACDVSLIRNDQFETS